MAGTKTVKTSFLVNRAVKENVQVLKLKGYTLIELLIVVMILGVLASIAVPAYQKQMERGRRADAKACIMDVASREERFYTQYSTYTETLIGAGGCAGWACGLNLESQLDNGAYQCSEGRYVVALDGGPADCSADPDENNPCIRYTITATPLDGRDEDCTSLSMDNTGTESSTGSGSTELCWR